MGNRLLHLTKDMPKCMLSIRGKPLIEHHFEALREYGINDISIVKGFSKEKINYPEIKSYHNYDFRNNNILASLFYAEDELDDDVIISYSDILYEKEIIKQLINAKGDIVLTMDTSWKEIYATQSDRPIEEAEKVFFEENKVKKIGKHLSVEESNGEFIGLVKLTKKGAEIVKRAYKEILEKYEHKPFQQAVSPKKAYLTDLFQELIDKGHEINYTEIKGNWMEIDSVQDLKRAGGEITLRKIPPEERRLLLKKALDENGFVRAMETHNGISAIIANNSIRGPNKNSFDALWISSLTESAANGYPDIEVLGANGRLSTVSRILEVTNRPVIIDGDTGGDPSAFEYFVRKSESLGASAVIIEDKTYPKRNSLDLESKQILEDPEVFAKKIRRGKDALLTNDFMIIARIESFIAGKGLEDAINRAKIYLEAGADGIMIHSNSKSPDEVISFAKEYKKLTSQLNINKPLICVPTSYNSIKESELRKEGFNMVIYANHLLRSSIKSMQKVCQMILENERALEVEEHCSPISEIFDIVGFSDIKTRDKKFTGEK